MRLATYNIRHALGDDGHTDPDRFQAAVRRLDADVLALQEVERAVPRSQNVNHTEIAARALGAKWWKFAPTMRPVGPVWVRASSPGRYHGPAYGIGLVSRYPVRRWLRLDLPRRTTPSRHRLRYMVPDEARTVLAAVVDTPDGTMTVMCTHLTVRGGADLQLEFLRDACAGFPRPVVLLGDLNLRAPEPAQVTQWTPLATAMTHPIERPVRQIDHILADGPVAADGDAVAIDTGLSDHRALVIDAKLE